MRSTVWNAMVPTDPARIGAVRHAAERHLTASGVDGPIDAIVLMISELLTNALRHGSPPATISVNTDHHRVRVAVSDRSPAPPQVMPMEPTRVGGNGMRIIDSLASTWGFEPVEGGKAVWFEVVAG
jgi:anti-sigma regulatory factor (Ser/Thr protein kinase)